jgi:glyoxalase family protein
MEIGGLHHVTLITGDAPGNLEFYTRTLGLRLVKRTVNQDDVSAYHLFYGDETGRAGTEVTFFDWPGAGPNRPGAGTVDAIGLGVPAGSLPWWRERLESLGATVLEGPSGHGSALAFTDPEGQQLYLAEDPRQGSSRPWPGSPVPAERWITGLHSVRITSRRAASTARVLHEVLGFRQGRTFELPGGAKGVVFESGPGGAGTELHVIEDPSAPPGAPGIGGVHHLAFRTPDDHEHRAWRERVAAAGIGVTPVVDRFYFKSIYFREPGGVLFEIATDGPGFATDEDPTRLGETLALPPFLEPHRRRIEAGLKPLPTASTSA